MASLSIPPPAGPTSTRLDWRHTEDRGSTVRSENKGRGGASRSDRGRGGRGGRRGGTPTRTGRGHASPPTEKSSNAPSSNPGHTKSAPPIASTPSHTSTTSKNSSSSVTQPPPPLSVDLPGKPKAGSRRAQQQVTDKLPSLTIEPASPTVMLHGSGPQSASTTSSKLSTRRRRSNNKHSVPTISSESLTVDELASVVKARKARSGPSSPHTKESLSKNTPPHLSAGPTVTSFSTTANIDSLVEHVRALAMDHRPSTPGSHIDWAGDEDDSLPDLDDWGVSTSTVASAEPNTSTATNTEKAQLQLMSPILDDSLKQLPQNFDKSTPSPSVGSGSLSPNIANRAPAPLANGADGSDSPDVNEVPSSSVGDRDKQVCSPGPGLTEPPSQSDPHAPESPLPSSEQVPPIAAPSGLTPPLSDSTSELPARTPSVSPPPIQSGRISANPIHAPSHTARAPSEARGTEPEVDISTKGLSASIHAPTPKSSESESGPPERPRAVPVPRNPTHGLGRSHTLGRQPPFSAGAKRGFSSVSSTSAGVPGAGAKGPHHGRTQSSPVTHRRQHSHSRPVITLDAKTRIAKSLGKFLPLGVTATKPTTSSE